MWNFPRAVYKLISFIIHAGKKNHFMGQPVQNNVQQKNKVIYKKSMREMKWLLPVQCRHADKIKETASSR